MTSIILPYLFLLTSLQQGDDLFVKQEYQSAIASYETYLQTYPNDAGAEWRISRALISLGDVMKKDEREPYYRKAQTYSASAVQSDSLNSDAHTWYAISVGYVSMYEGTRSKVKMANVVKHELDYAIQLNPQNDVAYSVLGTFYRALGNISWFEKQLANLLLGGIPDGGFEDGERVLKKAIAIAPTIIRHRFELGVLYLDWGKKEEAKKIFLETVHYHPNLASDSHRIEFMKKKIMEL
ncbi:MAG: hypothetical protein PHP42_07445 [Bacteroidota bacterium]|nr:hypothetical protein [Bacteroidota bacterium]